MHLRTPRPLILGVVLIRRAFSVGIIASMLSCSADGQQADLLTLLEAQGFSLVETGGLGSMRILRFKSPPFETWKLADQSALVGISESGDRLLTIVRSERTVNASRELEIATLRGEVVTTARPTVRGMTVLFAELAPDHRLIAFVGNFCRPAERPSPFGLHVLSVSGEIRMLVGTAEADEPNSVGWSRDGKVIVYDTANRVFLYHLDTQESTLLAAGSNPTWSPDGDWIAYRRPDRTAALIRPNGTQSKGILDNVQLGGGLRWSPDGRFILYTDFKAGEIRVLNIADGRTATVLAPIDQYTETRLRWVRGFPR
jgi:dipeptidyl aminopeptidase/acylaminoacyl peptidase